MANGKGGVGERRSQAAGPPKAGREGCQNGAGLVELGTISRKTSDSTDKCNGQNLLDIAVTNALELLRGQNFEN
jgi:hypothetical protein